jgi:hypothetical protein
MATYESISTNTSDTPGITITKPSGLAVGDEMVAGITVAGDGSPTITAPAGWTTQNTDTLSTRARFSVFTKLADSADVAASNFTFTATANTTGPTVAGFILRSSDFGILAGEVSASGSGTTISTGDMTPTREDCLFCIIGASGGTGDVTPPTSSNYRITTNNPTWTERADVAQGGGGSFATVSVATATRPEATAIGAAAFDLSENKNIGIVVLALSPQANGSVTQETKLHTYALNPIPQTKLNAIVGEPSVAQRRQTTWTEPTKETTEWTNKNI